jgi:V-type H+-transporting ATPase subunit F
MLIQRQHITAPPDLQKNFLVVDSKTENAAIEEAFERFTTERKDIGILLINQHVRISLRKHKMMQLIRLPDC